MLYFFHFNLRYLSYDIFVLLILILKQIIIIIIIIIIRLKYV